MLAEAPAYSCGQLLGPEMRAAQLRPQALLTCLNLLSGHQPRRLFHGKSRTRFNGKFINRLKVPKPLPFAPDVETFFTLIGRGLKKHASKFPTWKSLFALAPADFRAIGIEPPRLRRYLIRWIEKYRVGNLGPGADFLYVEDGIALLKIASSTTTTGVRCVVNVPPGIEKPISTLPIKLVRPIGYKIVGLRTITGPFARLLPGNDGAVVKVTEGMWEDKRGRKIDGGERRQTYIRHKRRSMARREALEAESLKKI
ncbi:hypothetical protein L249_4556 [Ophiocordyceps polyrhachis-furcata BCC 54312]|uniref:Small ribosomal subunit protein mS41 n=1 Tax=Ophiocordyceps polyrhachis-furcata BCC 54312 TaxID=1330021 RepID=A0A367KZ80_9HYPO|nr:hypothetical protein L249_4556 [Ophiocordyceps polyrhachis-furcata BCC 54312]